MDVNLLSSQKGREVLLFISALIIHLVFSSIFIFRFSLHKFATLYDAGIFIGIAENGYTTTPYFAMFPLFPFTIRLLSFLTGNFNLSAVILSPLFSALSTVIFYRIAQLKSNHPFSVAFFFIFALYPWFTVSSLAYSEPLYMFLLLSCFYLYLKNNMAVSSILAGFAALTRLTGVLLFIPLLYKSFKEKDYHAAPLAFLPLLFVGGLFLYFYHLTGNLFITFEAEREWAKGTVTDPGTYLIYPFSFLLYFAKYGLHLIYYWRIVFVFLLYTAALISLRKDVGMMLFTVPTYLLIVSLSPFPTFGFGLDRFLIPIFPIFFAYEEHICKPHWVNRLLFFGLVILFVVLAFIIIEHWCLLL